MTPKILSNYEKTNAENVKDLLNRRQSHLKNASIDDDSNATTVKGLYEKAKKQGQGPLYDINDSSKYKEKETIPTANLGPAAEKPAEIIDNSAAAESVDTPDYQQIVKQADEKKKTE